MVSVVTQQKGTEREITKTKVGDEIEIFITSTNYNTSQWRDKSIHCWYYVANIFS